MQRTSGQLSSPARLATDTANIVFVGILFLLTLLFPHSVLQPNKTAVWCLTIAAVYIGVTRSLRYLRHEGVATLVYVAAALLMTSYLFEIVGNYQHIFVNAWQDEELIVFERAVFGSQAVLSLQRLITPALTEWMMFAYVMYVPLLVVIALICYKSGGVRATEDYLLNLTLANIVCYVGFILFPVAGPVEHIRFSVPLDGGFFTWCGEWMRAHVHYPGGSLPSPHCAAATVMLAMLNRYNRKAFYYSIPLFLTLYVSTVYGRFHYATDAIAGILCALFILRFSELLVVGTKAIANRRTRALKPIPFQKAFAHQYPTTEHTMQSRRLSDSPTRDSEPSERLWKR